MEEVVRLRGHHLLCLLGFRGLGYDEKFVENMTRVHARVFLSDCAVEIVRDADDICRRCPRLTDGCDSSRVNEKDAGVLQLLSVRPGDLLTPDEIYRRVSRTVAPEDLQTICPDCRWRSLGYCEEGLCRLGNAK